MTKEELAAENERLGKEVAALRTLLAAVQECANLPFPANVDDEGWRARERLADRRAGMIAVYADADLMHPHDPAILAAVLHDRAAALRKEAARPLRYTPKGAEPAPEPEPDSRRYCDILAPVTGRRCTEQGPHAKHRNGLVVWDDEPAPEYPTESGDRKSVV